MVFYGTVVTLKKLHKAPLKGPSK